jgi:hypothetical protein
MLPCPIYSLTQSSNPLQLVTCTEITAPITIAPLGTTPFHNATPLTLPTLPYNPTPHCSGHRPQYPTKRKRPRRTAVWRYRPRQERMRSEAEKPFHCLAHQRPRYRRCLPQNQRLNTNLSKAAHGARETADERNRESWRVALELRAREVEDPEARPSPQDRRLCYCCGVKEP